MDEALSYEGGQRLLASSPPKSREQEGDGLHASSRIRHRCPSASSSTRAKHGVPTVQPCFASILQGDHTGVEVATSAHEGLLQASGLLDPKVRVRSGYPLAPGCELQGLVIDDYFIIGQEPASSLQSIESLKGEAPEIAFALHLTRMKGPG